MSCYQETLTMAKKSSFQTNKNAHVITRIDRTGRTRTETSRRDSGIDFAISTDERNNSTRVFIDLDGRDIPNPTVELNGHDARALYLALQKHFSATGKRQY